MKAAAFVCGPGPCPNDPHFEHDNYYGCIPKDFKGRTGRSKTHVQREHDGRWYWTGGCAAIEYAALTARPFHPSGDSTTGSTS